VGTGLVIGFLLISNPVGWGVAIGIGSSSFAYGVGKGAGVIYESYGKNIDVADSLGIDTVCH
jgi:hypothetical protein